MKRIKFWMPLSLVVLIVLSILCFRWLAMKNNSDFATEVLLEYHYVDKDISLKITDEGDILILKQILNGRSFRDTPACGFTTEISVTITDGSKSIVFCPANDGCPLLRIGESGKYIKITDKARTKLNEVLEKYGMTFPCV